jgi:hypothetical protein
MNETKKKSKQRARKKQKREKKNTQFPYRLKTLQLSLVLLHKPETVAVVET